MNRVVHFEIMADDTARAKEFYEKVFNWKIEKWKDGREDYWLIDTGPKEEMGINGGLMNRMGMMLGEGTHSYICTINVSDLDKCLEKIKECGGTIMREKMNIEKVGQHAYCHDTEGNMFGVMQPSDDMMKM